MKANDFDKKFNENTEDMHEDIDLSTACRINQERKQVCMDVPVWLVDSLDREAERMGCTRQTLIKMWLEERLNKGAHFKV